ncbi:hypothetical protein V5799_016179 [Amblyomma americanum]|uniref:M13 family peptidase n=1 Tax=Amblyomma americanum TaxID=6943 RepID=A0AAQ4F5S5_AMBAM
MESRDERLLFGAVVAAIAVVFSLLIAGLVLLLYTKRVTSPLACVTAECLAARDYLVHLLNTSKDACSDFYGYVCDSWLARGPDGGSFHGDSVTASLARINESLWNQEGEEGESEDTRLVRRVYRQCHRYASDRPTTTSLKETLRSARKQLNWAKMAACRHYHELVALLVQTSLLVGLHSVMVLEILSEDDRAVMRVSRGRSLHRKLMSTSDHRGNLEAIFRTVMEDEAKDLPKILEIDALAERDLGVADSTGTEPSEEAHGLLEEFLDGLVPSVKATNWLAAVNGVLMPLDTYTMRISDLALASGIDSIRKVFKSITTQHGIADIALYLASHLDAEVLAIELSRSQVSSDRANTAHFCLELVLRSYAFLWPQHAPRLPKSGRRQEVLETMYSQLQGASKGSIMFTWLPKEMRPYAEEKVKKVGLSVVSEDMLAQRRLSDVWWTPEAINQYNGTTMCLQRLLYRLGLRRHLSGSAEYQQRDMFLRVQGLRLAYDGLVASFGTAAATHGFRQLWAEAQAAFFARFCLLSCDADQTPRPLSPRANCLLPLHNMPEFGAVFDCVTREDFVAHQCLR